MAYRGRIRYPAPDCRWVGAPGNDASVLLGGPVGGLLPSQPLTKRPCCSRHETDHFHSPVVSFIERYEGYVAISNDENAARIDRYIPYTEEGRTVFSSGTQPRISLTNRDDLKDDQGRELIASVFGETDDGFLISIIERNSQDWSGDLNLTWVASRQGEACAEGTLLARWDPTAVTRSLWLIIILCCSCGTAWRYA